MNSTSILLTSWWTFSGNILCVCNQLMGQMRDSNKITHKWRSMIFFNDLISNVNSDMGIIPNEMPSYIHCPCTLAGPKNYFIIFSLHGCKKWLKSLDIVYFFFFFFTCENKEAFRCFLVHLKV